MVDKGNVITTLVSNEFIVTTHTPYVPTLLFTGNY